jgi:hypothetical protein
MAMRIATNPNRMELLKLRRRLGIARRGHKLLKDKFDELMKPFLAMIKEVRDLRLAVESELCAPSPAPRCPPKRSRSHSCTPRLPRMSR